MRFGSGYGCRIGSLQLCLICYAAVQNERAGRQEKQGEQITFFDVAGLAMPFGGLAMGKSMFSPFGIVKDSLFFGGKQVMKRHAQKKERRNGRKSDKNTIFGFLPIPFFGLV